jgi:hypothetical protein
MQSEFCMKKMRIDRRPQWCVVVSGGCGSGHKKVENRLGDKALTKVDRDCSPKCW